MKVLKPGRITPRQPVEETCVYCGAVLLVSKSDIFTVDKFKSDSVRVPVFRCPECGKITAAGDSNCQT